VRTPKFHKIWTEQCEATQKIRLRYGPQAAFDYVVAGQEEPFGMLS
jgi:hypothetical protein